MKKPVWFGLLLAVVLLAALSSGPVYGGGHDGDIEKAERAQENLNVKVLPNRDVVGTAIGRYSEGEVVLRVFTAKSGVAGIPNEQDGVKVKVQVTGPLSALPTGVAPGLAPKTLASTTTERWTRPVPIGISTGNEGECSSGTIGARVKDADGKVYALSNNHVYALENNAALGSNVLQPGRYDTGCATDSLNVIGQLSAYELLKFDGTDNTMDAAMASSSTANLGVSTPADGYGTPSSATTPASLNQNVQKYGRTTQLTKGKVTGINATVNVGYGSGTAKFVDQIIVESTSGPVIKAGDSGSLLVTDNANKNPVGLLFAGTQSGKLAVANRIDLVLTRFGVSVDDAAAPPAPDFSLSATPSSLSFPSGGSGTFNVSVTTSGGFTGTVTLTSSSSSPDLTVTPASATSASPSYPATTFTVASSTLGSYTVTVTGTSGALTRTASISITVGSPPPPSSLTITVDTPPPDIYPLGATVLISGWVTNSAGTGVSGATVTLIIDPPKGPNLTPISPPVTNSEGNYSFNFTTSKRTGTGIHRLTATVVGSNTATSAFLIQ